MRSLTLTSSIALFALAACNDVPEGAVVAIAPETPVTGDDLTAVLTAEAVDNDEVTYSYAWSVDGSPAAGQESDVVPSSATAKGQQWTVVVTPNDGRVDGVTAEASVTIANTPPTATVAILPAAPTTLDELVVEAEGTDVDGDAVTLSWTWNRDGSAVAADDGDVPAELTQRGQLWEVIVTPSDGEAEGEPVTASVVIANTAPEGQSVAIEPGLAFVDTELEAVPVGVDVDGDPLSWTYTWRVNGAEVQTGPGSTLVGAFVKGDEVVVEAVVSDGQLTGDAVTSSAVTILNSPPEVTGAAVDPADARGDSVLSCLPVGARDADGDEISYTYSWTVDGREVATTATLDGSFFRRGQRVSCTLTPSDGTDTGTSATSSAVEILNTPPVLDAITLGPDPARTADVMTVTTGETSDLDGDDVTLSYAWTVGGAAAGSGTATLDASEHAKGDVVTVTVTPNDGTDDGVALTASLTIQNTAPTTPGVTIDPTPARIEDDLVCEITTASVDADGDTVTYTVSWTRDGSAWRGSTGTTTISGDTIDSSDTADDEVWACSVTASDGTDTSTAGTDSVTVRDRDGQVRKIDGTWIDVDFVRCGTGTSCNGTQAKAACRAAGGKVVSHASDGTSDVLDLGATNSCHWATSYFEVDDAMPSGACLVGVSNLDWSTCCRRGSWHGNTLAFGTPGTIFGYVRSISSGHVSSYPNVSGRTWGCQSESSAASVRSGCTSLYVACAM